MTNLKGSVDPAIDLREPATSYPCKVSLQAHAQMHFSNQTSFAPMSIQPMMTMLPAIPVLPEASTLPIPLPMLNSNYTNQGQCLVLNKAPYTSEDDANAQQAGKKKRLN